MYKFSCLFVCLLVRIRAIAIGTCERKRATKDIKNIQEDNKYVHKYKEIEKILLKGRTRIERNSKSDVWQGREEHQRKT